MTEIWHLNISMLSFKYLNDGNPAFKDLNAVIQLLDWRQSGIQIFKCCHL